jgi:hypothetical protein
MGDRVVVTFTDDGTSFTSGVYMHWAGAEAPEMIRKAAPRMRRGDAGYAAARFCGECHAALAGNLGLGLLPPPVVHDAGVDWTDYSHGDAGVYIVNVQTGVVDAHGGYGKAFTIDPEIFGGDL